MQDQPGTTVPPNTPSEAPSTPLEAQPAPTPTAVPETQPKPSGGVESGIRETGERMESAARDFGRQLDAKIETNETAREVKQKVGSFWNKIKEKIQ